MRSLKGCAGPGGDIVQELHINARSTHAVSFCTSANSGVSYIATWGLDTSEHKHVARHNKVEIIREGLVLFPITLLRMIKFCIPSNSGIKISALNFCFTYF